MKEIDVDTTEESPDGIYPMRIVTRLTGLSADTIRVWERRYRAVQPGRTDGNARRYSDAEVKRLLLLKEATSRGHAIGEIGQLPDHELLALASGERLAERATPQGGRGYSPLIDEYLQSIVDYDARRANELLNRLAAVLPPRDLILEFVIPMLRETGRRWECGEVGVSHEHMVSSQVKGLLGIFLRLFPVVPNASRIVLGTPQGQLHEFGSVVAAFLAATRGVEPIYIGPDIPYVEMDPMIRRSKAKIFLLAVTCGMEPDELARFRSEMDKLREHEIWVGCPPDHGLVKDPGHLRLFHDFESLDAALAHRFYSRAPGL